jgi:hypothetical protein
MPGVFISSYVDFRLSGMSITADEDGNVEIFECAVLMFET